LQTVDNTNQSRPGAVHWVVKMNHRNRTASWWIVFLIFAVHFHATGQGAVAWALMALQFLVYPHVVYPVARYARDPLAAELNNLRLDDFCFGLWTAWLGFPLWITFLLVICGCINLAAFRGFRGALQAAALSAAGAAVSVAAFGLKFEPDTTMPVTALSMACLTVYLLLFARGAYFRALSLSETRHKLRLSEQALQGQLEAVQALQAQLTEQANRDPLTGLYNRRYLNDSLRREFGAGAGQSAAVLLVDIDHFKQINDRFGHSAGDQVIRHVATLLQQQARANDVVCRYGGEEFLVLLPGMDAGAAMGRAEWYRQQVGVPGTVIAMDGATVTLSIGVAGTTDKAMSPERLIDQADQALYLAKSGGRNRSVLFAHADAGAPMS
jgi:diguanylate cyclase (GGDEF)-like protein